MSSTIPNNVVILLPENTIMGWGLMVKDRLPILVDRLTEHSTPSFDCPYKYQFSHNECPLLDTDEHDSPAQMKYIRFHDPVDMETVVKEEGGERQIYIKVAKRGDDNAFWLKTVVTSAHRLVELTISDPPDQDE